MFPGTRRGGGLFPQPGYKGTTKILITKKNFIIFVIFLRDTINNVFGRGVGIRDSRTTIARPTCYFCRIFVLRSFWPPDGPLVHFCGKCRQIARNGPIRAKTHPVTGKNPHKAKRNRELPIITRNSLSLPCLFTTYRQTRYFDRRARFAGCGFFIGLAHTHTRTVPGTTNGTLP